MDKFLIRKDVYEDLIEKGYGKRDLSKLQKVQITDKNGHTRNVYKKTGIDQKEVKTYKASDIEKVDKNTLKLGDVSATKNWDNSWSIKNAQGEEVALALRMEDVKNAMLRSANRKAGESKYPNVSKEEKVKTLSDKYKKKYGKTSKEWESAFNNAPDETLEARYEEMLKKVKTGPDENALFVRGKGMLNKEDAIANLEGKLGKTSKNVAQKMADSEDKAFAESEKDAQKKYGNMSIEELKAEAKKYDGVSKYSPEANEARKVYDILNQKLEEEKKSSKTDSGNISYEQAVKAVKDGKTVQWKDRNGNWNDVDSRTSELVMARDIGSKLRIKPNDTKKPSQDDMKENYLDARNEAGKDIAENSKIQKLSDKIEFSPDEMKMIRETAKEIGYRVGRDEGYLLNTINSKDKNMYSALTKKNKKIWDESGKTQKTFSTVDLLKEKIQSMNGDFGADTEKVSLKDKVKEWEGKGLPKDAAYAKVAFDDLYDGYENKFDEEKEEINETFRDIQKNGLKAKYFKDHAKEYGLETENKARDEFKSKMDKYKKMGLDERASAAIVAMDEIEDQIRATPDSDVKKLDELRALRTDVQLNGLKSKYIRNILG